MAVEVTYCIVNTEQRALLLRCLDAVARERAALPFATEVLVLDNASRDGSAGAARSHPAVDELIRLERRRGRARTTRSLLKRARGRYCLLLNEDAELRPGATAALVRALDGARGRRGGRRGAAAARPAGASRRHGASRRRPPRFSPRWACTSRSWCRAAASAPRVVDWSQSAALLVRRDAAERIGWFDPRSSSTPTRSTSASGSTTPAGPCCSRPAAQARPPRARSPAARCRSGASSSCRATATATCASTTGRRAALAVRWLTAWTLRGPLGARGRRARARPAPLPPPRDARRCSPAAARALRGGRGVQPRPAPLTLGRMRRATPTTTGRSCCCCCPRGWRRSRCARRPRRCWPRRARSRSSRRGCPTARSAGCRRRSPRSSPAARPSACGCPACRAAIAVFDPLQLPLAGALIAAPPRAPSCGTSAGAYAGADFALDLTDAAGPTPGVGADGGPRRRVRAARLRARRLTPRRLRGRRASTAPTASSVHVTGSSRNAAYSHVCTTTATKPAATTARYGSSRAPPSRRASAAASSAR